MKKNTKMIAIAVLLVGILLISIAIVIQKPTPTLRYVVSKVSDTYYAKTPEGTILTSGTDAAMVINSALDALTSSRTSKEKVLLQGNFALSSTIELSSYSILEVSTGGKLSWEGPLSGVMLSASDKNNFEVVGGEWDAKGTGRPFEFLHCSDVVIKGLSESERLIIHTGYYDNLAFNQSNRVTISNVETYNPGHTGILMADCSNCVLENSHIHDCPAGGCYFYCEDDGIAQTISNNIMRNNLVERTYLSGLSLASLRGMEDKGSKNLAEHNTVVDCGLDGTHPGIACGWGENRADHCIIRYNTIYETKAFWPPTGNGTNGAIELACDDSQVYENTIYDTYDLGIGLMGDRNTVSGNQISGTQTAGYGAISLGSASNNQVVNNIIKGCPTATTLNVRYSTGCSNNHIANNQFEDIENNVIVIAEAASTGNIIENNTYTGTWRVVDGGTDTIVRDNSAA